MASPKALMRELFPPPDRARLRFRGGLVALPIFLVLNLIYPMSLQQADWVDTSSHFGYVALLAILFGTLIGNGPLRLGRVAVVGSALGTTAVMICTIIASSSGPLRERAIDVATRTNTWLTQAVAGEAASDPTVFVLLLGATVWAASFVGSFALAREKRALDAVLLCGVCLTVNVSLALTNLIFDLVVFTLCALVLLTRLFIVSLQERWERKNIQPTGEMDWRLLRGGLTWTTVLVIMALVTPRVGAADALSTAMNTFEGPYHAVEAEWQRFFAGVTGPSRLRGVSFSDSIRLGQAPNLGDRVVMTVESPQGRFWRAVTYDFYTGAGWRTTETERVERVVPAYAAREKLEATFDVFVPHANLLFAANEPQKASVPHQFQTGEDRNFSTSLRAVNRHQAAGAPYVVTSFISNAGKRALRAASTNYPAYIRQKYLQLPTTITQRTKDMAHRVTDPFTNAYDKAEAIENHLRQNYRYSTTVKTPPLGRDPVDYFLFDLKEDFCEFFATSMVVMLRELGIPARMVEGFTTGTFNPETAKYEVRELNAHAWVEAYFVGYGWIEFEPTPSETVFVREDDLSLAEPGEGGSTDDPATQGPDDLDRDLRALLEENEIAELGGGGVATVAGVPIDPRPALLLLVLLLLALLAAVVRFEWRFRRLSPVEAAWGKTRLLGAYTGHPPRESQTVYEYAASLTDVVPGASEALRTIAVARVHERYAAAGATEDERENARDAWGTVARELLSLVPQRVVRALSRLVGR